MPKGTWRIALAQTASKLGELEANVERHLEVLETAKNEGASLVVFPELSLTGYDLRDLVPDVAQKIGSSPSLDRLAAATSGGPAVAFGFVEEAQNHIFYNAAGFLCEGQLQHVHRKVHLPTYGMFDEERYFGRGRTFRAFDTPLGRLGMLICEDFWHLPPSWILAMDGAKLLLVLAASPVKTSRPEEAGPSAGHSTQNIWSDLARMSARMYTMYTAFANAAGTEDQVHYGGGSFLCDPTGTTLVHAEPLDEGLVIAEIAEAEVRRARVRWPLLRGEHPEIVLREFERLVFSYPDEEEGLEV